jgi:hypothetical protein
LFFWFFCIKTKEHKENLSKEKVDKRTLLNDDLTDEVLATQQVMPCKTKLVF